MRLQHHLTTRVHNTNESVVIRFAIAGIHGGRIRSVSPLSVSSKRLHFHEAGHESATENGERINYGGDLFFSDPDWIRRR